MYICQQEKICEDSASFDLSSADIASAMRELSELSDKVLEWVKEEEMGASNLNDSQMAISKTLIVNLFNLSKTYPYSLYFSQKDFASQILTVDWKRGYIGVFHSSICWTGLPVKRI